MKEFAIYTGMRLVLLLSTWAVISGVWALLTGSVPLGITLLLAFVVSGVGSYFVLRGPREAFARKVEARAGVASERFEEMKAKEDER